MYPLEHGSARPISTVSVTQTQLRKYADLSERKRNLEEQLSELREELLGLYRLGAPVQDGRFRLAISSDTYTQCRLQDLKRIFQNDEDYKWLLSDLPRAQRTCVRVRDSSPKKS